MLTEAWKPLRYHPTQSALWRTSARFVAVPAGRGSGKTELARRRVVRMLPVRKPWPNPMYFYAMPTRAQTKRVAWQELKLLVPKSWLIGEPNETEMMIETVFGSRLYAAGLDKPQRIEGTQWDGGILDESCDIRPGSFQRSIVPALSHRNGWCWRIGVPKRHGIGAADFHTYCDGGAEQTFTWPSSDILTPEQLQWAKDNLDPKDYREQYEASWETVSGLVFYAFDERENVSETVKYDPRSPLLISMDFNVDPMAWVICQERDGVLLVIDELWVRNAHTGLCMNALALRYLGQHQSSWEFYGDATSQARKTSAAITDYVQIKNDERFRPKRIRFPRVNPPIRTRFSETNAMLCSASGVRRTLIHPRCRNLIADLKVRGYDSDTVSGDIGHITDALGYIIHKRYPIRIVSGMSAPPQVGIGGGGGRG